MAIQIHPLAELIPPMMDPEFEELKADIAANGYRDDEPIILYEEKILDGRHRHRACRELGVSPACRSFEGDDPVGYVISKNLHRRHLTKSQVAMTAAEALPHLEEEARKRQAAALAERRDPTTGRATQSVPSGTDGSHWVAPAGSKRAAAEAASLTGASTRSVGRAKRIKEADPELAEQVKAGEVSLTKAEEKVSGKPHKEYGGGLETKEDASGRQQPTIRYGKGDKWQEATEPLVRYLRGQRNRNFDFSHLNWKEAKKRVERIDSLITDLEAARADLEPRSHKAKLSF